MMMIVVSDTMAPTASVMISVAATTPTTVMIVVSPAAVTMAPTASVMISVTATAPALMIVSRRRRYETNSRSKR
ncbi:MAG TPA: hypothetical protein VGT81_19085 [Casimicrobiaceae bacterium]|nr:hypothetical protein [Casimicrobiaceae bacterium]